MKMSPWRSQGVLQTSVAVVERDASVEGLIDVDFGSSKAEALALLRDLKALALPLDDVVVADYMGMDKAANAVQIFGRGTPCGLHFAGSVGEAAVVVGEEQAEHGIAGVQIASLSQAQLAAQTILEYAPETFDAAFGLEGSSGDEGDAELLQGASELGGLTVSGGAVWHRPEVGVAHEVAPVIAIEGEWDPLDARQLARHVQI